MSLTSAMGALSTLADSVSRTAKAQTSYDINRQSLNAQLEREQMELDRAVLSSKFQTTQTALNTQMNAFFTEQVKNPDYSTYQAGWDSEYSRLMATDNLKAIGGLTDDEAQRFVAERGSQIKNGGDIYVSLNRSASARNFLSENLKSFSNVVANMDISLDEAQSMLMGKYDANGGNKIDISGTSNPATEQNRLRLASQNAMVKGKKAIERAISDPDYSFKDAMNDSMAIYDSNMEWVGAKENTTLSAMQSGREEFEASMSEYYSKQNQIAYTKSNSSAERAYAYFAECRKDGSMIDMDSFKAMLESRLDITGNKMDRQVYLDAMLKVQEYQTSKTAKVKDEAEDRLTGMLASKVANSENIGDIDVFLREAGFDKERDPDSYAIAYNRVKDTEQGIRSGEVNMAQAVFDTFRDEITARITDGSGVSEAVAYGRDGVIASDSFGNVNLVNSLENSLYIMSSDGDAEIPAVRTVYSPIIDDILERQGITDPDVAMALASLVNRHVAELNAIQLAESEGTPTRTASDEMIDWMLANPSTYTADEVLQTFNQEYAMGNISNDYADDFYTSLFGSDGSKWNSPYMKRAIETKGKLETMIKTETDAGTASRLLYYIGSNGNILRQLEQWHKANPNATEKEISTYCEELAITVSSQDVADNIQSIIDFGYRQATGFTDTSAVDSIFTVEEAYKLANGKYSYLINPETVEMGKKKLYSESASTYKKTDFLNDILYSVSGGRFKTMKALDDDKKLSSYEKSMYKNITLLNASQIVMDVSMYRQSEAVAKGASSISGFDGKVGKNLQELHVKGLGNAVMDEKGIVYLADGSEAVGIYYIDPESDTYRRVYGSPNATVYSTDIVSYGTYSLYRAEERKVVVQDAGQWNRYAEGYAKELVRKQSETGKKEAPKPGTLEYYGKGGYTAENYLKKSDSVASSSEDGKTTYSFLTKKDEAYMASDPALYTIIERIIQ